MVHVMGLLTPLTMADDRVLAAPRGHSRGSSANGNAFTRIGLVL
jgi:hypothetical protein